MTFRANYCLYGTVAILPDELSHASVKRRYNECISEMATTTKEALSDFELLFLDTTTEGLPDFELFFPETPRSQYELFQPHSR